MRKGAWLNRIQVVRQARQTNENDVRIAKISCINNELNRLRMPSDSAPLYRILEKI
jgi:hypothetical protein